MNPFGILFVTIFVLFVGSGIVMLLRPLWYESDNPSRSATAQLTAGLLCGLAFLPIAAVPLGGSYHTSGVPSKTISTLSWPLGVGRVTRGTFIQVKKEGTFDTIVGLVLGMAGDTISIDSNGIRINEELLEGGTGNMPALEPGCALKIKVDSGSALIIEKFMSSWLHKSELKCEQFVLLPSWSKVSRHLFFVVWPWDLFGMSRVELGISHVAMRSTR
jgi:hypothetical protein